MKYFKRDDTYYAIDKPKGMLYSASKGINATICEVWDNRYMIEVIETSDNLIKISAKEFQEVFSSAVEFLHNETPFA